MKLVSISIKKLFGQFDYNIEFNQEEGITILTGPNGYGKTTILNIVAGLFNKNFNYILSVPFQEIDFTFDDSRKICVTKKVEDSDRKTKNSGIRVTSDSIRKTRNGTIRGVYSETESAVSIIKLCFELIVEDSVLETFEFPGVKPKEDQPQVLKLLESIKVYLIKDQRLTYSTVVKRDGTFKRDGRTERNGVAVLNKIDLFSKNLVERISKIESEENKLALNLANTFPDRLLQCDQPLCRDVFEERFGKLSTKQQCLQSYGITPGVFTRSEYEGENRRVLSVYLEDYERKTSLYDELLDRIGLFLSIMNSKGLVNKTFMINAKDGFCFTSIDNKPLQLSDLSSGEQHQTILLYELLFNAPPDSLVLIDEPETSMHVSWLIEFLQDIEKIAKINHLSFIIATHSPDLINDKIDLCVDLSENAQGEKQND